MSSIRYRGRLMSISSSFALGCAALCLSPGSQAAQPSAPSDIQTARSLFAEAEKDEQALRWEQALRKLQGVASIKQTAGVAYHLGNCLEHLGRLVQALQSFQLAQSLADENRVMDVMNLVSPRIESLRLRIPTLTLRLSAGLHDAAVSVDAKLIDQTLVATPIAFDPGWHEIRVQAPGRALVTRRVELIERQAESIDIDDSTATMPEVTRPPSGRGVVEDVESASTSSGGVPTRAWVSYAAGVSLALGGFLAFRHAGSVADDSRQVCAGSVACDPARVSTVHRWDGVALGAWMAAATATGLGVMWTVRRSKPQQAQTAFIVLAPGTVSLKAVY
jgi:hypothetical protein